MESTWNDTDRKTEVPFSVTQFSSQSPSELAWG